MGGDHAPGPIIEGAIRAIRELPCEITLVGPVEQVRQELQRLGGQNLPFRIEPSDSVVEMHESPAQACRQKPNSSIMLAAKLVAQHQAEAVVSAGNSGATMAA